MYLTHIKLKHFSERRAPVRPTLSHDCKLNDFALFLDKIQMSGYDCKTFPAIYQSQVFTHTYILLLKGRQEW